VITYTVKVIISEKWFRIDIVVTTYHRLEVSNIPLNHAISKEGPWMTSKETLLTVFLYGYHHAPITVKWIHVYYYSPDFTQMKKN